MRSVGLCSNLFAFIRLKANNLCNDIIFSKDLTDLYAFFISLSLSHLSSCYFYFLSFFETILLKTSSSAISVFWLFLENYIDNFNLTTISKIVLNNSLQSFDFLYGSLSWQERELSEMVGIFFYNKSDRRSAFLPPLHFFSPLLKTSPTSGYFDFLIDYETSLLVASSRFN